MGDEVNLEVKGVDPFQNDYQHQEDQPVIKGMLLSEKGDDTMTGRSENFSKHYSDSVSVRNNDY